MSKPCDIIHAEFLKSLPKWNERDLEPLPQICIAGRSNVGKSSLINALVNQTGLAKTSSTPGRTQDLVLFSAKIRRDGVVYPFHLVDLPGYGYAKAPASVRARWAPMVEGYLSNNKRLVCCVFLLDIRREPGEGEEGLIQVLEDHQIPMLPVVTKVDKVPKTQRIRELKKVAAGLGLDDYKDLRPVSVQEKIGIGDVRDDLFDVLDAIARAEEDGGNATPPEDPPA